jgi:hypothetical protein
MTKKLSGRTATLAIGLLMGLCSPSFAGVFDAPADTPAATMPATPADAQAAPANPAAAPDQLSDSDRAARQDDVKQPVIVTQQQGEQPAPVVRASPVVAGSQNATWDETSLIGKLFIGFGALLTVASAARMFMA